MDKVLISWLGVERDFVSDSLTVNKNGPTCNFYKYYYTNNKYQKHLLLVTNDNADKANRFISSVRQEFGYKVELRSFGLTDVYTDYTSIFVAMKRLLTEEVVKKGIHADILVSTGTSIMKLVWFDLQKQYEKYLTLYQILPPENLGKKPGLKKVRRSLVSGEINNEGLLVTESFREALVMAEKVAQFDENVLILGETGTGKEMIADYIHKNSKRSDKHFNKINLSAYTDDLAESRLFGYKRGAFTGANKDEKGIIKATDGGTLLLDEIGHIGPKVQNALIRFLETKEVQQIGATKFYKADVRIIAATNRVVEELRNSRDYRHDLFYRFPYIIFLKPLREYKADEIKKLVYGFVEQLAPVYGLPPLEIDDELMQFFIAYEYYGNIRELRNIIKNLYVNSSGGKVTISDLPPLYTKEPSKKHFPTLKEKVAAYCKEVYEKTGSQAEAAKILGITRQTLAKYLSES